MKGKQKTRAELLESFLIPILDEWGVDEVRSAIDRILVASENGHKRNPSLGEGEGRKAATKKTSAVEVVSRMNVAPELQGTLLMFAERYDAKQFLATAGDIRQFFEDRGLAPPIIKHRSDAFRKIVSVLCDLPKESQQKLLVSHAYAGPSQLEPLSNAIRQSGAALRKDES